MCGLRHGVFLARSFYRWALASACAVLEHSLALVRDRVSVVDLGTLALALSADDGVREVGEALIAALGDIARGVASQQAALTAVRAARGVVGGMRVFPPKSASEPTTFGSPSTKGGGEGVGIAGAAAASPPPSARRPDGGIYLGRQFTPAHADVDAGFGNQTPASSPSGLHGLAATHGTAGFDPAAADPPVAAFFGSDANSAIDALRERVEADEADIFRCEADLEEVVAVVDDAMGEAEANLRNRMAALSAVGQKADEVLVSRGRSPTVTPRLKSNGVDAARHGASQVAAPLSPADVAVGRSRWSANCGTGGVASVGEDGDLGRRSGRVGGVSGGVWEQHLDTDVEHTRENMEIRFDQFVSTGGRENTREEDIDPALALAAVAAAATAAAATALHLSARDPPILPSTGAFGSDPSTLRRSAAAALGAASSHQRCPLSSSRGSGDVVSFNSSARRSGGGSIHNRYSSL
jgi:hypothetical protein